MTQVLRSEELIFRRQRTTNLTNIESPTLGARRGIEVDQGRRKIGEWNVDLAFCERGQWQPARQCEQASGSHHFSESLSTRAVVGHTSLQGSEMKKAFYLFQDRIAMVPTLPSFYQPSSGFRRGVPEAAGLVVGPF